MLDFTWIVLYWSCLWYLLELPVLHHFCKSVFLFGAIALEFMFVDGFCSSRVPLSKSTIMINQVYTESQKNQGYKDNESSFKKNKIAAI